MPGSGVVPVLAAWLGGGGGSVESRAEAGSLLCSGAQRGAEPPLLACFEFEFLHWIFLAAVLDSAFCLAVQKNTSPSF